MRKWRLLGSSCLLIYCMGLGNPGAALPVEAVGSKAGRGDEALSPLQDWDLKQAALRESAWQGYSLTAALGRDARGRTAGEDLGEWVMTDDVIGRLQQIRDEAERHYRSGDEKAMRTALKSGEAILQEQQTRLLLVSYYWQQKVLLDRHRDLWMAWEKRAPEAISARSRDRIQTLEASMARDFSPNLPLDALTARIDTLKRAYNEERIKLAAATSSVLVAAGGELDGRSRSTPCAEAAALDQKHLHDGTQATTDRPVRAATTPPPDQFYPQGARRYEITGRVTLLLSIDANGCMKRAQILRSSGAPELDDAAIDMSEQATYFAAEHHGQPVESSVERVINFELDDSAHSENEPAKTVITADEYIYRGNMSLNQQQFDGAIANFDKALAIDPAAAMALADRGMAYLWKHEDRLASKDFDAAFEIDPNNAVAFRGRGMLALQAKDFPAAIAGFTSSLERDPHNLFTLQRRAQAYIGAGDKDRALADAAEIIRLQPNSASGYAVRGHMLLERRDYDLALADFDKAIAIDPKNAGFLANRGFVHVGRQNFALAQKDFDAAFEIDPRNPAVFRGSGVIALGTNDVAKAITAFTTALELEPGNLFTLQRRAETLLRAGENERALADAAEAIRIRPSFTDMYSLRAMIYRIQGSADQSAAEAKSLTAANPDDSSAYLVAGAIYSATGRDLEATRAFDHAVQIKPNESAYLTRAYYRRRADFGGKRADIDAALKLNAASTRALMMLADMQSAAGEYSDALATLGTVSSIQGTTYDVLVRRGVVYAKSDQTSLAETDFASARAKAADSHALNTICWQMATSGVALTAALAACDAAVAEDPNNAAIIDSRGFVLLRLGRLAEAVDCYDSALKIRRTSESSLYGRGLARLRQGTDEGGKADIRAALAVDANIAEKFSSYGLHP
jgi:TonB family protein